mgnify:CR=1 FL=1
MTNTKNAKTLGAIYIYISTFLQKRENEYSKLISQIGFICVAKNIIDKNRIGYMLETGKLEKCF